MSSSQAIELLTFDVGGTMVGLDIRMIQEITKVSGMTTTPKTPGYIEGIINLRGNVVTIVNLGKKMGLEPVKKKKLNTVIITSADDELIGLMIDEIHTVIQSNTADFDSPPSNRNGAQKNYFKGVLKRKDLLVGILEAKILFNL